MDSSVIGKRISCDGEIGTVLYEGSVPPTEGDWLGIDWDNASRGKHDGSYKGVQYFTSRHKTSGSFIRPQKADFGISYCEAVRERYGFDTETGSKCVDPDELYHLGSNNVVKPIEILGLDQLGHKQSQFDLLQIVILKGQRVAGTTCEENILQVTPNVTELDLSKNLINSWETVSLITGQLQRLDSLTLSENRLLLPNDPAALLSNFRTIQKLILCQMDYNWGQILLSSKIYLNVVELYVANNSISSIQSPDNVMQNLKMLDLDCNPIKNWQEVLKLGQLPCLETLHVNNCQIPSVFFPDVSPGNKTTLFPKLTTLSLNENQCSKWADVAELNKLPTLAALLMNHNPICESETTETTRQLFIAKLAGLKVLNRTIIKPDERRGAELDYLKKYGKIWLDAKGDTTKLPHNFLQEHPRYTELGVKYGVVEKEELVVHSSKLNSNIICIQITSPLLPATPHITRKLPATMTVQKLKNLIQKLYKVDSSAFALSYISAKKDDGKTEIPLDNDQRALSFFSLENGDMVIARW